MATNNVNPTVAWICGTVLLVTVLIGLFILVWHGSISGASALAVLATVVGIGGGALGVHAGVTAGTRSANGSGH